MLLHLENSTYKHKPLLFATSESICFSWYRQIKCQEVSSYGLVWHSVLLKGSELHKPEHEAMQNRTVPQIPFSQIKIYCSDSAMLWLLILQLLPQQIEQWMDHSTNLKDLLIYKWSKENASCHKPLARLSKEELGLKSRDELIFPLSPSSCRQTRSAKTDWTSYGSLWGDRANCFPRTSLSLGTNSDVIWVICCIPRKMSTFKSWWAGLLT